MPKTIELIEHKPISWFGPEIGKAESRAVQNVLNGGYLNDGDVTRDFERRVAEIAGVKHCVAVTSGTVAIAAALMGLGVGPGDEVIVPDFTFVATANAVRLAGATVKLVDVEPKRFTIDPEQVRRAIGSNTKAIVPVDVNGRGSDYEALEELCREFGLVMVCDATEALGSHYAGKPLGSFGAAGCFSFSANKTVTCGQGGMVSTNDTNLYHRLLELKDQGRRVKGTGGDDIHPTMGFNFKLTNVQAAIGVAQLDRLEERLGHARRRDSWYHERLSGCEGVDVTGLEESDGEVRQWADMLLENRQAVIEALDRKAVGNRAYWYPLHTQCPYRELDDDRYRNSIEVSRRGLWLPSYFGLTEDEADMTCSVIRQALRLG